MLSRRLLTQLTAPRAAAPVAAARAFSSFRPQFQKQQQTTPDVLEHTESYTPAEVVSGAPVDLSINRIVRIYQQAKPATQSGSWGKSLLTSDQAPFLLTLYF